MKRTLSTGLALCMALGFACGSIEASEVANEAAAVNCDREELAAAKLEFRQLRERRMQADQTVTNDEFRAASLNYISLAETCYQAEHGGAAVTGQQIDEWPPPFIAHLYNPNPGFRTARTDGGQGPTPKKHVLLGHKWGAGSPFMALGDYADAEGPRISGGTVTYSFMSDGVDLAAESAGLVNTSVTSMSTFESCFLTEIADAFGAWSAVADIEFVPVSDDGTAFDGVGLVGDIRIGAHAFDGAGGTLAHALPPPPLGISAAGDLHFDIAEPYFCDPTLGAIDFGLVALHEIGHSIGLGHEGTDAAVMEPFYNAALMFGPLADDIIGVSEIYGPSPVGSTFFSGDLGVGTDHPAASVHVVRRDGSSSIRVDENATTTAVRTLFQLNNNGAPRFALQNSTSGTEWSFQQSGPGNFLISLEGTGGPEMQVFQTGRVRMGPSGAINFDLAPNGNLKIAGDLEANGTVYTSDRKLKENISDVRPESVLTKLMELPISTWNFKRDEAETQHMGPMAQDFYRLFALGKDDKHLNPVDTAGVALAAIQGLYRLLEERESQLAGQEAKIRKLELQLTEWDEFKARLLDIEAMLADR